MWFVGGERKHVKGVTLTEEDERGRLAIVLIGVDRFGS